MNISHLSKEQIKEINKFLVANSYNQFSRPMIQAVAEDLLDVCYKDGLFVKGCMQDATSDAIYNDGIYMTYHCLYLKTAFQNVDLLLLDHYTYMPIKIAVNVDMDTL